ncbi:MAG: SDR family oxidoreductase [Actinomycetota bacterium]|nr:SDR family oxidoreductase [Actinomycetota bacterium]
MANRPLSAATALALGLAAERVARRVRGRTVDLSGRVALVTGGSRGLGLALAQELAREGCRVAICARTEGPLERARSRLEAMGADVLAEQCDVSDREQVERLVAHVTDRLGPIDVLVNVAGVIAVGPVSAQTLEDYEEAMDILYWGVVHPTFAVLPSMRERGGGYIVNVTSIGGKISVPHLLSYNAAKFAAVGFSEGLHAGVAKEGIHVLTVVPGLMRTGSYLNAYFKGDRRLEYGLFAPLATLPLTTISGRRAARRIVRATKEKRAEITLTLHANLLARANGIAPGLTAEALSVVDRLLPDPGQRTNRTRGYRIDVPAVDSVVAKLSRRSVSRFNQLGADES